MRENAPPSPAVVVGIDGSRRAVNAALWAVDEAVDRDVPLRLVYAVEPHRPHDTTQDFATAESAVRAAAMAIESTGHQVKLEVEIVQGPAVATLLRASRSAAMLCVGALGTNHATGRRPGSAATGLLARSHCPVAIVGDAVAHRTAGWVVTECDDTPDGHAVLEHALAEARRRNAPLKIVAKGGRDATARAERALARCRGHRPGLDVEVVAANCYTMDYVDQHSGDVQLVVVGAYPSPARLDCPVLVAAPHDAL